MMGCTQELDEPKFNVPTSDGAIVINISGSISQNYATRADAGGFCHGDQIGLFGVNYTSNNAVAGTLLDKGNQVDNARYTFDESNWKWTSANPVYYKDAKTNIDLYGYYPYANVESVNTYKFEVALDQSGANAVDGYAQSDFLWGKVVNVAPSEEKVKLLFDHMMACANVILAEGDGFSEGEFNALKKSVLAMNTIRTAEIDLSTGMATAVGDAESEGIVMKSNSKGFSAIIVPQNIEAGKALFAITINGISYRFKKDTDFAYEAGKQSKFTININKKEHSGEYEFVLTDTEIVDWIADLDSNGGEARQYYVVHCEEPGTLEEKIAEAKTNPNKIKNLKVSGKICAVDFSFMRDKMELLQAVNLKEAEIVDYWEQEITYVDSWGSTHGEYVTIGGQMPEDEDARHAAVLEIYPDIFNRYPDKVFHKWGSAYRYDVANIIPGGAFQNKLITNFSFPEKVTKIGDYAFSGCSLLSGALIIPDDVITIGSNAFYKCTNLTSLELPINLQEICGKAFYGCYGLVGALNIPETVTIIDASAFEGCYGLTGPLALPDGLTYLGQSAFFECSGFTGGLKIPEGITTLYPTTFYGCSGLNGSLILHDNLTFGETSRTYGIFENCNFQGELKLPANLKKIPTKCFWSNNFYSIADFPDGLLEIGSGAFGWCNRLSGVLEFPESLVSLGGSAFYQCYNLEGIVLPSELVSLGSGAFEECCYINKIVCKSWEPPTITSDTFRGVAKDNFAVEVPERSINRYQSERYWGEFKRIEAHHDFTISRRLMRTLNAEQSRKLVLRAPSGLAWSVESCPEWVTVTPSSGVGKVDVIITVNEMTAADVGSFEINTGAYNSPNYETHAGRSGEIVFLLNDKDARVRMAVEQYDYEYGDGDVIVNQTATKGRGVNLVFMGDCFDARDIVMGSYIDGVTEAIGHYFDVEPYKTYRDYFNVYTVLGMSNDSGMGTESTIRDAKFGSQYLFDGIMPNHTTCYEYAMKAKTVTEDNLDETLVVLIENSTNYGGKTYLWSNGSAIACCPMSADAYPYDFRGVVQHEACGHGFAKLADECIYHAAFLQSCACLCHPHADNLRAYKSLGWYRNLEESGDTDKVAWSHLIYHPKYSNIVDIYEGGYYHSRGVYRSEPNSCMNNNIPYFSAISRQEIVERIMKYAGREFDINEFYANDVLDFKSNITSATRSYVEENAITLTGASKQMPPKFMGDKPQLTRFNE